MEREIPISLVNRPAFATFDRESALPSLRLIAPSRTVHSLGWTLLVGFIVVVAALLFVPWVQVVRGDGAVTTFDPQNRIQTVKAAVKGRVVNWKVQESSYVHQGDELVSVVDLDPRYLSGLKLNLDAATEKLVAKREKVKAYQSALAAVQAARSAELRSADLEIEKASQDLIAARQGLLAAEAAQLQAKLQYERTNQGNKALVISQQDLEIAENKQKQENAKLEQAKAKVIGAEAELDSKRASRIKVDQETLGKIAKAEADLRDANAEVNVASKEEQDAKIKLNQADNQVVTAPRSGTVLRILASQDGEVVKEGDELLTLVPDTDERIVEIQVDGNDAPLVSVGRTVRVQFEGFPALQFSGWPSAAVGTFGGRVIFVDPLSDSKGKFRVLIEPDPNDPDPWPSGKVLRQGLRVTGFVQLNTVPLGWEIWRNINGFPPIVDAPTGNGKNDKPPKVKK